MLLNISIGLFLLTHIATFSDVCASSFANEIAKKALKQTENSQNDATKFLDSLDKSLNLDQPQSFFNLQEDNEKKNKSEGQEIKLKDSGIMPFSEKSCQRRCISNDSFLKENDQLKLSLEKQMFSNDLIIFITLGMQDEALKTYGKDNQKVGGRLVIRGLLKDSFIETQKRLKELGIEVDIDPILFDQYHIKEVPAFVLTKSSDPKLSSDSLKGNVTIEYALEQFKEHGNGSAEAYLIKLRNSKT